MSTKSSYVQTFANLIMDANHLFFLYGCKKSYWDRLPREIQEYTVSFVESQQLIDAQKKDSGKALCHEILQYGELKVKWDWDASYSEKSKVDFVIATVEYPTPINT